MVNLLMHICVTRPQWVNHRYDVATGPYSHSQQSTIPRCVYVDVRLPYRARYRPLCCSDWHMMTSWNGNIIRVTGHLCGEFTGPRWTPAQRPVTRSFDVFFDLHPNKRLSKQWRGWWFETPSCPLWRHRNESVLLRHWLVTLHLYFVGFVGSYLFSKINW